MIKIEVYCKQHGKTVRGDLRMEANSDGTFSPDAMEMFCTHEVGQETSTCEFGYIVEVEKKFNVLVRQI